MTTKYFCDYCGEEFERPEECRAHENECADALKNEILIYTKALSWVDGRTFIENDVALEDILIIKNTGHKALLIIDNLHKKICYCTPLEYTTDTPQNGFYYWSVENQTWVYISEWNDTLTRIINTGSDIWDD